MSAAPRTPALRELSFLNMVSTIRNTPQQAYAEAFSTLERAEQLGFQSGWVFTRHVQRGLSSPVSFLSAASQRTSRIGLGAAVVPLEYERLLNLAEGLSTLDIISGGRLEFGVSTHRPRFDDADNTRVYGAGWPHEDFGPERIAELKRIIDGEPLLTRDYPGEPDLRSTTLEPVSPGLGNRMWQGAGSLRSVTEAAQHARPLLLSNIATVDDDTADFWAHQQRLVETYRAHAPEGARVKLGLVVIPTDGATPEQLERHTAYAAPRAERVGKVGPGGMIAAPDLFGPAAQITEQLQHILTERRVDELKVILPFVFDAQDHQRIIEVVADSIAPQLGWSPLTSALEPVSSRAHRACAHQRTGTAKNSSSAAVICSRASSSEIVGSPSPDCTP